MERADRTTKYGTWYACACLGKRVRLVPEHAEKSAIAYLLVALVLCGALCLAGCANDQQTRDLDSNRQNEVCASLTSTLQSLEEGDGDVSSTLFEAVWFYPEDYGVSSEVFATYYFAQFEPSVDKAVEIQSDVVDATITVTLPRIADVLDTLARTYEAAENVEDYSTDGYADAYFEQFALEDAWTFETQTMDVSLARQDDGTWQVEDKTLLAGQLLGGYDPRQALYD